MKMISKISDKYRQIVEVTVKWIVEITVKLIDRIGKKQVSEKRVI